MSTTALLAGGIATLMTVGLVVGVAVFSLLCGAFYFLFSKSQFKILRPTKGNDWFAFSFDWNAAREPARIDKINLKLFNPFGKPTRIEVTKQFSAADDTFARELEMGKGFIDFIKAQNFENASVEIELSSTKDNITYFFKMKGKNFLKQYKEASQTAEDFNRENEREKSKVYYHTTQRSFIADPLPASDKVLKIATNPEFAGEFASEGGGEKSGAENFSVSKVWIEPGCIVCDACEGIYPEVFEVQEETCVVRPDYPKDNGLLVLEAAEACPVEVIKFDKA